MRLVLMFALACTLAVGCGRAGGKSSKSSNNTVNNGGNNGNNGGNNGGAAVCGNGVVESGENCDKGIADGPGACPTACSAASCSVATLSGSVDDCSAVCTVGPVGCMNDDGCCQLGCDSTTDNDCTNTCGDGVMEGPELCDGNCPTACGSPTACSIVELSGDAASCSAQCVQSNVEVCQGGDGCCPPSCDANGDSDCGATCGNGTVEPGESCDGNCPTSCDDGVACTVDAIAGSPETCNVICINEEVAVCVSGDGCCPVGCSSGNDSDCSATCGNGAIDANETCDGNCPTNCSDNNVCTRDTRRGATSTCNVECVNTPISVCQGGDGCCPSGCTSNNDSDCTCVPDTCAGLGIQCGPANNGCGGTLQCGNCASGTCTSGVCDEPAEEPTVGQRCNTDADCNDPYNENPYCLRESDGYPGGYCTATCQLFCVDGNVCNGLFLEGNCEQSCGSNADCRPGYSCTDVETLAGTFLACRPN